MKHARRRPRRRAFKIDEVLAATKEIAARHARYIPLGYDMTGGRLFPCQDGTYTARVVYRSPQGGLTITVVERGLVLR